MRAEKGRGRGPVAALKLMVCGERLRVADQFFTKFPFEEPLANWLACGELMEGNNDISVETPKWAAAEGTRQRMLAIEMSCPDVNDDLLIEPRFESSTKRAKYSRSDWPIITNCPRR
jgi:hypothetical protein